jgi:hypothetical protein
VDYEAAQISALKNIFDGKLIYGCIFHYAKASLNHLRTQLPNLHKEYHVHYDGFAKKWVRRLISLPLLEKDDAQRSWERISYIPGKITRLLRKELIEMAA